MKSRIALFLMVLALALAACATPTPHSVPENPVASPPVASVETQTPVATPTTVAATEAPPTAVKPETPTSEPSSPSPEPTPTNDSAEAIVQFTVLYTNDEHGWMLGEVEGRGAANMVGLWRQDFGYEENGNFLVLSGGDNWTGPAISTWFEGESMVDVMNAMGYDASVIGNHEFDFGLDALKQRLGEANFPYLSANIRYKDSGEVPTDLGIEPYALVELDGLTVGLIGLTTTNTEFTTDPQNIGTFDFIGYTAALREVVPEVIAAGADLILVPSHLCTPEIAEVKALATELGIVLVGGGHCNELVAGESEGVTTLVGGAHMATFAWATITVKTDSGEVLDVTYGVEQNEGGTADPAVAEVVNRWQAEADETLNDVIGYLENDLPRRGQAIEELITESWLVAYPQADIALTNRGGIRDSIIAGDVTLADIIGVLPFNNVIIEAQLTGAQLEQALAGHVDATVAGGMHRQDRDWVLDETGERLDADAIYSVLVNSFMYAGGDGYTLFASYDPDAYNTGIDWRQPVIDWILEQDSSPEQPLDEAIAILAQ